jgi:hypothetical protein
MAEIRNRIFQDRPIAQRGRGARGGATNPTGAPPAAQTPPPASNPAVEKNPNLINWWLVTGNGAD